MYFNFTWLLILKSLKFIKKKKNYVVIIVGKVIANGEASHMGNIPVHHV